MVGREPITGVVLGLSATLVVFLTSRTVHVRPVEALRWSLRRTMRLMLVLVIIAVITGALYGWLRVRGFWLDVVGFAFGAVLAAFAFGLEGSDHERRVEPNQGIRQSLRNAAVLGTLGTGHDLQVYSLAFSPDGNTLATASQDGTVRLFRAATAAQVVAASSGR